MAMPQVDYGDYSDTKGIFVMSKTEWVSTEAAAKIMDVAEETVRRFCREGVIECEKLRRDWQVNRASAEAYVKKKSGRPKGES